MVKYLITGATGYIGSTLVRHLLQEENDVEIIAVVRDLDKARKMFPAGVTFVLADVSDMAALEVAINALEEITPGTTSNVGTSQASETAPDTASRVCFDYVIHCAAVTKSAEMAMHPVEVGYGIIAGTENMLELAKRGRAKSVVFLSSMEVYGNMDCPKGQLATEEDVAKGEVALLNVRSCYPLGKRMAENLCFSYYKEYNLPVKIARLAQTFGHGVPAGDSRVFSQFARAIKEKKDIVLHTDGSSMGNYCAIEDAVNGILQILKCGENGEAYNVVNESCTMTIREMAELVCTEFSGGKSRVVFDIPEQNVHGYAANTKLRLSAQKLRKLGWRPTKGLKEMYADLLGEGFLCLNLF